jgi:hypothetical protein
MKYAMLAIAGLMWMILSVPDANAVVCARGVYRAGCAGPRGAVVVRRPIVRQVARCYWRRGVRVCR